CTRPRRPVATGTIWRRCPDPKAWPLKPLHSAPSPQPGALSPYSAFRRILHQQREAARYAPPQSNAIWPFPVIKSFFFVLRLVIAWFLAVLLVGMMWSELPLLGRVEWPIVLLG